jgi:hypothetical protein
MIKARSTHVERAFFDILYFKAPISIPIIRLHNRTATLALAGINALDSFVVVDALVELDRGRCRLDIQLGAQRLDTRLVLA